MLTKKMFRDILTNKGSYAACIVIVTIGLTVFTSFSILSDNLNLSKETFYREQNFAQGFVELESMPEKRIEGLQEIEGIENINGRVKKDVRVNDETADKSIYLTAVSLDFSNRQRINDIKLLQGSKPGPSNLEVIIDNQFYEANNLKIGDKIQVISDGRAKNITVQGAGMSPEFTYPLRTPTEIFPNPEQYGIAFYNHEDVKLLFPNMENSINNLVFNLEPEARFEKVREELEDELSEYGVKSIYSRDEQTSHLMLSEEVNMLERVSTALPLLFLGIAAIILFNILKRLVEQQRMQIGILKAFGYTNKEIMGHYISYALFTGAIGGIIGGIFGIILATPLTNLLLEFFNVPEMYEKFSFYYLIVGILLSLTIFSIAGYKGCKYALKLKPAEAMRPPAPVYSGKIFLEKIKPFWDMLTIQGKMSVRNIFRNKGRSAFLFVGIMLSCAVIALTWSMNDMVDKLTLRQFEKVETYDARLNLENPGDRENIERELKNHENINRIEPMSEIPVSLKNNWLKEDVLLIGLSEDSRMYNILDHEDRKITPTEKGIILSERLAEKLNITEGAKLKLESPYIDNEVNKTIEVTKTIPQYLGMNAYLEINALDDLLNEGKIASSFLLRIDENVDKEVSELREYYMESQIISGIDSREEMMSQTEEFLETFGSVIYLYALIGIIIGFAIIYSSSFIILSERSRELASMRVLGMTSKEVFSVITFEQWFISFIALIISLPVAQVMQWSLAREISTDHYILPSDLSSMALFIALILTVFSIWIAQRFALRKIRNLSLVDVLKSRE